MTEPLSPSELAEWKETARLSSHPEPGRLLATIEQLEAEVARLKRRAGSDWGKVVDIDFWGAD